MPLAQIALVSQTSQLPFSEAAQIGAALQKQVARDFAPIWNVQAIVSAFVDESHIPMGYWPIFIRDDIKANAAGIHSDRNGQPFALVEFKFKMTSLLCSHECLEMLADPFGNRLIAADSLKLDQGRVNYLLEVCDPCQHPKNGYPVNNYLVSDFYTPNYFDPVAAPGVRYSFRNTIVQPKQVLPGGYVTWQTPDTTWWQARFPNDGFTIISRGKIDRPPLQNWREVIDRSTKEPLYDEESAVMHDEKSHVGSTNHQEALPSMTSPYHWTTYLRKDIDKLIAKPINKTQAKNSRQKSKNKLS